MKKIFCPACRKVMSEHDGRQIDLCLKKFIKVATNPVVYAPDFQKMICPTCEKDMLEHNQEQTIECLNKFVKQVTDHSD
jgi:hypothetical protein|tara:strand:+ start:39 stop:275 length:237 start_codon:yes stop_codon:yes gene_type:complete